MSHDGRLTVVRPSFDCRSKLLKIVTVLALLLTIGVGNAWADHTLVKAGDMATGEKYIITAVYSGTRYYLIPNSYAEGAASSAAEYSTDLTEDAAWTFTKSSTSWVISTTVSKTTYYLGNNNKNNGVKSSTTLQTWSVSEYSSGSNTVHVLGSSSRYLALYHGDNWRSYSSSSGEQEITLYKVSACTPITPTVSYSSTTIYKGDVTSSPTITGNTGSASITWTSSDPTVATVNSSGVVTALKAGTTTIKAAFAATGDYCSKEVSTTFTVRYRVKWSVNGNDSYSTGSPTTYIGTHNTKVSTLPTDPGKALCDGSKEFVGWTATPIVGSTNTVPSDLFTTAAGAPNVTNNVTYYAVFATVGTATFQASDITNTPATGNTREWGHTASGTLLYLSAGQYYTSVTPYTWTVTNGTSNYARFTAGSGKTITKIVATISGTNYKINSVTKGTLSTSSTTQTITGINNSTVDCKATSSYQIRITQAVVTYASAFATSCCTKLGTINGSIFLTKGKSLVRTFI